MEVVFTSVVRIKGEHTKNYLAMNSDGNLYVSVSQNKFPSDQSKLSYFRKVEKL